MCASSTDVMRYLSRHQVTIFSPSVGPEMEAGRGRKNGPNDRRYLCVRTSDGHRQRIDAAMHSSLFLDLSVDLLRPAILDRLVAETILTAAVLPGIILPIVTTPRISLSVIAVPVMFSGFFLLIAGHGKTKQNKQTHQDPFHTSAFYNNGHFSFSEIMASDEYPDRRRLPQSGDCSIGVWFSPTLSVLARLRKVGYVRVCRRRSQRGYAAGNFRKTIRRDRRRISRQGEAPHFPAPSPARAALPSRSSRCVSRPSEGCRGSA